MYKASSGLAPEGFPVIGLCTLASVLCALLECWPLALAAFVLTCFCCHFFRDPERVIPQQALCAVSPADGKVVRIEQRQEPFSGELRTCVSIFMNVFNVHVNRAPVAGTVTGILYTPGLFLNAALDKASTDNERCACRIRDAAGESWIFVQIAGLIARRVVCRVEEKDTLKRGQRIGMIRFGSRLDLFLPESYTCKVSIGENVFAGQSIIAHHAEKA